MRERTRQLIKPYQYLYLLAILAIALISVFVAPVNSAKAEEKKGIIATVDYDARKVNIEVPEDANLYYYYGSATKTPTRWRTLTVTEKASTLDISKLSVSRDYYLYLKGDVNTTPIKVKIDKRASIKVVFTTEFNETNDPDGLYKTAYEEKKDGASIYGNFSASTGYFLFTKNGEAYTDLANIQWKVGKGDWAALSTLKLSDYLAKSTRITFCIKETGAYESSSKSITYVKQAAAPKITVNGSKLCVTLRSTQEYRFKVGEGNFSDWSTPTFPAKKTSAYFTIEDLINNGTDGIDVAFGDLVIEVRTKATIKKIASNIRTIEIPATELPEASKLEVTQVSATNIKRGLRVTNNTTDIYQVAVINTLQEDGSKSIAKTISAIDPLATSKKPGYVSWTTVRAGKSVTLGYSKFSKFPESYAVITRRITVKNSIKTEENEFRLASVVRPVGGDIPVPDVQSGTQLLDKGVTSKDVTVTYTVENKNSKIYISKDGGTEQQASSITFTATPGSSVMLTAYSKNTVTGEESDEITIRLTYAAEGDTSAFEDAWGYNYCLGLDSKNGNNNLALAYQKIYLAYVTFNADYFDVSDLKLTATQLGMVQNYVRLDNPILTIVSGNYGYTTSGSTILKFKVVPGDEATIQAIQAECELKAAPIIAEANKLDSTLKKVKYVHDALVTMKQYKKSAYDQTIAGMFSEKYTPVCMSYAMSFQYCMQELGIQSYVVLGKAGKVAHAWNIVNYGEKVDYFKVATGEVTPDASDWYEMDVTWDDPVGQAADQVSYDYFNMTTAQIVAKKHYRNTTVLPVAECTGTDYAYVSCVTGNYFALDGVAVNNATSNSLLNSNISNRCGLVLPKRVR